MDVSAIRMANDDAAAQLYDDGLPCGAEANSAKPIAARVGHDAAWQAVTAEIIHQPSNGDAEEGVEQRKGEAAEQAELQIGNVQRGSYGLTRSVIIERSTKANV